MTKRLDVKNLESITGTLYPPPFDEPCRARKRTRLGDPAGLTQFGVNLLRLPSGAWSSQRHWHTGSDEFVYVLSGEVVPPDLEKEIESLVEQASRLTEQELMDQVYRRLILVLCTPCYRHWIKDPVG